MTPDLVDELNKEEPSMFHQELLDHAKALVRMSRMSRSRKYSDWDMHDEVFRGIRTLDKDDVKQSREGRPTKMIVPNTFAQVMTFNSFLFLMFNQNRTFYELMPTGDEDFGTKDRDCEKILERDLRKNKWNTVLFQHLLDVGRFGTGITECCWTRQITRAHITPEPTVGNYNGVEFQVRQGSAWQEFVKYEGNLVRPVSPYRFFPDTRFPLTEFQRGEFCAAEEEYSKSSLRDLEKTGEVAGVEMIQPLPRNLEKARGAETRTVMDLGSGIGGRTFLSGPSKSEGTVLVTKMQVKLVPSKFTYGLKDTKLGPEEFPILYHLWYANDNRIIRCEPAYWWHNEFGWTVAQFTPDMHHTMSTGLADLVYRLQDVITWFVNAHITSVRRVMQNRLVVDPSGIETETLDGEGDIYIRKGMGKAGIDRFLKQLEVQDVTSQHMGDVEILGKLMQIVTGVNDNAMGQYNSGRRSAQEARVVTAGAAGRMKLHGHLIWSESLGPLGRMMLSNSRQSLGEDSFRKIIGGDPQQLEARYSAFKGTPEEVITGDDYFTFDSTLSSEKGFIAQSLQELLAAIIGNPLAAQQLDLDPRAILDEVQYLRGAGPISRFSLSKRVETGQAPPLPPPPEEPQAAPAGPSNTNAPQIHLDRSTTVHIKPNGAKAK